MPPTRAAIVGTGYIAGFHARAIRLVKSAELVAVCDTNLGSARSFAAHWGITAAFDTIESMLNSQRVDVVHVLTPPDQHYPLASVALRSGAHVFLEKPMCISVSEAEDLLNLARDNGRTLGVNHNFLYSGAYQRLRNLVHSGGVGPVDHFAFNYFLELPQIRSGPFNSWMLRAPGNEFLEVGPHLISALLDLVGEPECLSVTADREVTLPGGAHVFRRWRIHTNAGRTAVDMNVNLGPGFSQRTIGVRGQNGSAVVDLDANTCAVDRRTPLSFDLDRYRRSRSLASQIRSQAGATLADYLLSTIKLRHRGPPYQATFLDSVESFYSGLSTNAALDGRIDGKTGRNVIEWCNKIIQAANVEAVNPTPPPRQKPALAAQPTVLVFGGAGFIGRELIGQLLAAKYCVRAVIHRSGSALEEIDSDRLEIVRGDMGSETNLKSLMKGIDCVFHLARADAKSWNDYLQRDVKPARLIAEACLEAGVKRLIYTGTIASYYAGAAAATITEQTPLDDAIARRDYYSRAKAEAEGMLMEMYHTKQLPLVIFRPGIVIGQHGSPFHWGVGMWISEGLCDVWGDGKNKLPFVLVRDVAAALVRGMLVPGIEGRTYNLVDLPLLTAREYLEELQRRSGVTIDVRHRAIFRFYLTDLSKWLVKLAVHHPDWARIPSYRDWESRTQKAIFDCSRARSELDWSPASDRQRMIDEGIQSSLKPWLEAIG
jgi:predicted dehydrogenase/nucleoside-diphosphate-sugar epimerase